MIGNPVDVDESIAKEEPAEGVMGGYVFIPLDTKIRNLLEYDWSLFFNGTIT